MSITKITTHATDALARLLYQYQDSTNLRAMMTALFGTQVQDLEDAIYDLSTRLDIDASEGQQLDGIGEIVGQSRDGMTDALYRIWIKAKIATNVSMGGIERVITVWQLLVGATRVNVTEDFPAGVLLYSNAAPDPVYETEIVAVMQRVVSAGVSFDWAMLFDPVYAFELDGGSGFGLGDLDNPAIGGQLSYILT